MTTTDIKDLLTLATALATLGGAALGIFKYFNYRSHKDLVDAVGTRFTAVVDALGSPDQVKRRAAAIMLRRFFDPRTEFGAAGAPYRSEAVNVIAAVLREERSSNFQKLLADGLWYARSLRHADLQKTNLRHAYLGARGEQPIDLSHADFYGADLSHASLKQALAVGTIFYQARLSNTVFSGADLRDANFFEADLQGAQFKGARLDGADFRGARNVPAAVAAQLDSQGRWRADAPSPQEEASASAAPLRVFYSRPSAMCSPDLGLAESAKRQIALLGAIDFIELPREDYPRFGALAEVRQRASACAGMVVLGVGELDIAKAVWRAGSPEEKPLDGVQWPSPWTQIEAGMGIGLGLPVLLLSAGPMDVGVFAADADGQSVFRLALPADFADPAVRRLLGDWNAAVRRRADDLSIRQPRAAP